MVTSEKPHSQREILPDLPRRVGGDLALDLANTIGSLGTPREHDYLATPEMLVAWALDAGLIDAEAARGMTGALSGKAGAALLRKVHALRDAIQAAGEAIVNGTDAPEAIAVILRTAQASLDGASLRPTAEAPGTLTFDDLPAAILGPLAWAALDLLRAGRLDRLKQCPPANCRWLFIDTTKNGSRRWCDMETCGSRAKAAASRRRRRHGRTAEKP